MSLFRASYSVGLRSGNLLLRPSRSHIPLNIHSRLFWKKAEEGVRHMFALYDDVLGLREVREMQKNVLEAESKFSLQQQQRREAIGKLQVVRDKLKKAQTELERVQRSDERFLQLVTEEHAVLREEAELLNNLKNYETGERAAFVTFSSQLRAAHESERQRAERTKWMSLIGSVCGALLGMAAATINNYYKHKSLKGVIDEHKREHDELKSALADCLQRIEPRVPATATATATVADTQPTSEPPTDDATSEFELLVPTVVQDVSSMVLTAEKLTRIEHFLQVQAGVGLALVLVYTLFQWKSS